MSSHPSPLSRQVLDCPAHRVPRGGYWPASRERYRALDRRAGCRVAAAPGAHRCRTAAARRRAQPCTRASGARAMKASSCGVACELIALSTASTDQRFLPCGLELPAQPLNIDVDDVGEWIVVLIPDVLRDIAAADDVAGTPRQILEQRVFLCCQDDLRVADECA